MRCSSPWRLGSIARPCTGFGNAIGARWMWSSSAASCRTASNLISSTLATATMSPGSACATSTWSLPLQHEEVRDLERLSAVADVEEALLRHRSLVDAKDAEPADEGIDRDLEDVREHVPAGLGQGRRHRLGRGALAAQERRRVRLARMRQQLDDDVEQLGDAGAGLRRDEADRDQVALAQRLLERRVQLGGVDVAVVEVAVDEIGVDLDDLLDEGAMRRVDAAEIAVAFAVVEAVDDARAACVGQVERQALLAERVLDLRQHAGQVDAGHVDPVDDDHAVALARRGVLHHAHRHRLDADRRVDDDRRGLHRLERGQALAEEVGRARRVDEVDARLAVRQVQHGRVERVLHSPLERVEVADRRAALERSRRDDRARGDEQRLGEAGLAGSGRADERERADRFDTGARAGKWAWHAGSPSAVARRHAGDGSAVRRPLWKRRVEDVAPLRPAFSLASPIGSYIDRHPGFTPTAMRSRLGLSFLLGAICLTGAFHAAADDAMPERWINASEVNLRTEPGTRGAVLALLPLGALGALDRHERQPGLLRGRRRRRARLRRLSIPERVGAECARPRRGRRRDRRALGERRRRDPARRAVGRIGDRRAACAQCPRRAACAGGRLALLRSRRRVSAARPRRTATPRAATSRRRRWRSTRIVAPTLPDGQPNPQLRPGARVLARAVVGRGSRRTRRSSAPTLKARTAIAAEAPVPPARPADAELERMKAHLAKGLYGATPPPLPRWDDVRRLARAAAPQRVPAQTSPRERERIEGAAGGRTEPPRRRPGAGGPAIRCRRRQRRRGSPRRPWSIALELPVVRPSLFKSDFRLAPPGASVDDLSGRFHIVETYRTARPRPRRDARHRRRPLGHRSGDRRVDSAGRADDALSRRNDAHEQRPVERDARPLGQRRPADVRGLRRRLRVRRGRPAHLALLRRRRPARSRGAEAQSARHAGVVRDETARCRSRARRRSSSATRSTAIGPASSPGRGFTSTSTATASSTSPSGKAPARPPGTSTARPRPTIPTIVSSWRTSAAAGTCSAPIRSATAAAADRRRDRHCGEGPWRHARNPFDCTSSSARSTICALGSR